MKKIQVLPQANRHPLKVFLLEKTRIFRGEYSSFFSFVNGTAAKAVASFCTSGSETKNN